MRIPRISGAAKASTAGVFVVAVAAMPMLWSEDRGPAAPGDTARGGEPAPAAAPAFAPPAATTPDDTMPGRRPPSPIDPGEEATTYREAAEAAYAYLRANRASATGLVKATEHYDNITTWDMGGLLLGLYSAMELELAPREEVVSWMAQVLETMNEVPLFEGAAYNKSYAASTGEPIGFNDQPSARGKGWSSTDLGRLLIAFKVAEQVPELAEAARSAAARIDAARVVQGGYLHGSEPRGQGSVTYQEGRIGYEQYAARGFSLWGYRAEAALDPLRHGRAVTVRGHEILGDDRGGERVTSEPFILMGMEVGWTPPFDAQAKALLEVQEARYDETGQVTIVSEDALQHPPHYFYYYAVWSNGEPFVVGAHGAHDVGPRWVSAKAAYAWHSLLPGGYTWRAVDAVAPARTSAGWASGVYEGNGRSTGVRNLNTAAVILEAALYRERGRPLLEAVRAGS